MTKRDPRCSRETIWGASCSVVEDALRARFVREDEVFAFICKLNAILELQEEFSPAEDKVV